MAGESTFLDLNVSAWTAVTGIATGLLFVAGVIAAIVGLRQLQSSAETAREEARAYVVVEFDRSLAAISLIDFVVRNIGRTPAFDVEISWTPEPVEADPKTGHEFRNARMFTQPLAMLPPGCEHRMLFDSQITRHGREDLESFYTVTVAYRDRWDRLHTDVYPLDVDARKGAREVGVKTVHDMAKSVEVIAKAISGSQLVRGPIEVVTESHAEAARREITTYNEVARLDGLELVPSRPQPKRRV